MTRSASPVALIRTVPGRAWLAVLIWLGAQLLAPPVWAAGPVDVYRFQSAEQEARYRALIAEFRCPKCLNTNLAGSDAPIAQDLRRTVHRLVVTEGLADQEIRHYLQDRYGEVYVALEPGPGLASARPIA